MIDIDSLKAIKTIVSHANCPDGVASALVLHDAIPDAEILFAQHGTPELAALPARPNMLFVDFSPPAGRAAEFIFAKSLVLDHHRTAKAVVEAFGSRGVFADEVRDNGVSGAVLAFREVWCPLYEDRGQRMPSARSEAWRDFAELAGVRDCWVTPSPLWDKACAQAEALRFMGFDRLKSLDVSALSGLVDRLGGVLVEKKSEDVDAAIRKAFTFTSARGIRVVVFEGVTTTSDAAEKIGGDADLVMGFHYLVEGGPKVVWWCRSRGAFDVSALAKWFGGGGHLHAAGFTLLLSPLEGTVPFPNPFAHATAIVDSFERSR